MDIIDTNFTCEYDMFDVLAEGDATSTTPVNQSFAIIGNLSTGTDYDSQQMVMEHNFIALDGTKTEFADTQNIAFFNNLLSSSDGNFTTNPSILIQFTENHSSVGLTLHFVENYPLRCIVYWYTLGGSLIDSKDFTISSLTQILWKPVENYGRIRIEFTKTLPIHYIKLNRIQYGQTTIWDETQISAGSLVESADNISNQLSINSLSVTFIDLTDVMNLGNSEGLHSYIQTKQLLRPYEYIRGVKTYLGAYFIKSFTVASGNVKLTCMDYIGILDMVTYNKGDVYNGTLAGTIIDSIMSECGITSYTIDAVTYNTPVYGTLKIQTCRKALREVLFCTQSLVDTSRSNNIVIYKMDYSIKNYIGKDIKISTTVAKLDYVSGITVKYNELTLNDKVSKVTTGTYAVGDTTITFNSPESSLILNIPSTSSSTDISTLTPLPTTTGEIIESGKYYCIIRMYEEASVEIDGIGYSSKSFSNTVSVDKLAAGELENVKSYTATLADSTLATSIATKILKYYTYRLQLKVKYLADNQKIQNWNIVRNADSAYNDYVAGYESITTDLTGGFVATATLVGYYNHMNEYNYAGDEIIADGDILI